MTATAAAAHVGRYRLLRVIGEGGMGIVHLGLDADDRVAAVKVLRPHIAADAEARARLAREVAALKRLRHARVAEIVDVDLTGPTPYVATRYVPGPPLDAVVREHGPLDRHALATFMWGLGEAISVIHAAGLVHRDIKPSNVLVLDGEPVVIDFGIARSLDDATLTRTGMLIGTPGYLAPELMSGALPGRSVDWWGWAAVSAFAATGRPPFGRGPVEVALDRIRRGDADLAGLPSALQDLLGAALVPDPAARPGAQAMRAALAGAVGAPAQGPTLQYPDQPVTVADVRAAHVPATALLPSVPANPAAVPPTVVAAVVAPTVLAPQSAPRTATSRPVARPAPTPPPPTRATPTRVTPTRVTPTRVTPTRVTPTRSEQPAAPLPTPAGPPPPASGAVAADARRRPMLTAAWLAAVTAAAMLAPTVIAVLGWLWATSTRAAQWTRVAQQRHRDRAVAEGRGAVGTGSLWLSYPVRWAGAAVATGLYLVPWLLAVYLLVGFASMVPTQIPATAGQIALAGSVLLVVVMWWGPGGDAVRAGTRFLTGPVIRRQPGRGIWLAVAVLIGVAAVLTLLESGIGASWRPNWPVPDWLTEDLLT